MHFEYKSFRINCTPRAENGTFTAQVAITWTAASQQRGAFAYQSGSLGSFPLQNTAIVFARAWAIRWCDSNSAWCRLSDQALLNT